MMTSIGLMVVILAGGIDLSIGANGLDAMCTYSKLEYRAIQYGYCL